jgi:uncharacterized protein (TIGR00251 family)
VSDPTCKVKVLPRSSTSRIVGFDGDTLKVKVKSAPVDGFANQDLMTTLSKHLRIPKEEMEIISGHSSRLKTIRFRGIREDHLLRLLNR